jgi:hypothetical protein
VELKDRSGIVYIPQDGTVLGKDGSGRNNPRVRGGIMLLFCKQGWQGAIKLGVGGLEVYLGNRPNDGVKP